MMIGILSVVFGIAFCVVGHLLHPTRLNWDCYRPMASGILTGAGTAMVITPIAIGLVGVLKSSGVIG